MTAKHRATYVFIIALLITILCLLCRPPHVGLVSIAGSVVGFWNGFAHGYLVVVDIARSFFDKNIGIYESHNNGVGYNVGFWLGQWFWISSGKIALDWAYGKNNGPAEEVSSFKVQDLAVEK
ncbi:MAG: hypothetical protein HQL19_08195 [Candidatus Omnitrophica bacterium]|nr:hypothetical protein [Candidatus Omnitrophota bacterium]